VCDDSVDENINDLMTIDAIGAVGASRVYNAQPNGVDWDGNALTHGTHVATIAAGNGFNSAASAIPAFSLSGHAPRAMIGDYPPFFAPLNDYMDLQALGWAFLSDNTLVTNHSYVQNLYGFYDVNALEIDLVIRGEEVLVTGSSPNYTLVPIPPRPQVWAVGNNGFDPHSPSTYIAGYYSAFTSAKNSISVGSLDTLDGRQSFYSSLGPTVDGRIKPDVVAPGCNDGFLGIDPAGDTIGIQAGLAETQAYVAYCGTSMAAPVVSGIVALVAEQYQTTFGTDPGNLHPSTYKAILVQTAEDVEKPASHVDREYSNLDTGQSLIFHAGPDFVSGFGRVNADAARRLVAVGPRWYQSSVGTEGQNREFCISVPAGTREVKVTLAWDDERGNTLASETTPKLVNDLDLSLTEPASGTVYKSWTIDSLPLTSDPGFNWSDPIATADVKPAYRGDDRRNNVEMANVFLPRAGVWRVKVKAHKLPSGNAQTYSLAASHNLQLCSLFTPTFCDRYPEICEWRRQREPVYIPKDRIIIVEPNEPVIWDKICQYVVNCPGCNNPGWSYCPGWEVEFSNVPQDAEVMLVNEDGQVVARQLEKGRHTLRVERMRAGKQHFLLFRDAKGKPYGKRLAFGAKKVSRLPTR
jgi:hypothetical protein